MHKIIMSGLFVPLMLICGCGETNNDTPPAPALPIVQTEHLYYYYVDAAQLPPVGTLPGAGAPTLAAKYHRAIMAPGLDQYAADAQNRILQSSLSGIVQPLSTWKISVGQCSQDSPALLTSISDVNHEICISPLLLTSIFLASVDSARLLKLGNTLKQYGIDPSTFNGTYQQSLSYRGVTKADWDADLNGDGGFSSFKSSVSYLIAYIDYCDIISPGTSDCAAKAAIAANAVDGTPVHAQGLVNSLEHALQTYDPSSWGFAAAGDGHNVLLAMIKATGDSPTP